MAADKDPTEIDEDTRKRLLEIKMDLEKMGIRIELPETFGDAVRDIILAYSKKAGELQFQNIMIELEKDVAEEYKSQAEFELRLQNRWKKPFDLLEFLIIQSTELGALL